MNSEIKIKILPVVNKWFERQAVDLGRDILRAYRRIRDMGEDRGTFELERMFGNRISRELCLPLGLDDGVCLVAAWAWASETVAAQEMRSAA